MPLVVQREENYFKGVADTQDEVIQRSLDELEILKESGDDAIKKISDELQVETHFNDALSQTLKKDVLKCLLGG